jgi:type VI secretion system secreted protein Hcp
VQVQDFSFVKALDGASGEIMEMVCTGKHAGEASLRVARAGNKEGLDFLKIKMSDILITSYQTGGSSGGQLPVEQVSFSFRSIEVQTRNEKGQFEPSTFCNFGSMDQANHDNH